MKKRATAQLGAVTLFTVFTVLLLIGSIFGTRIAQEKVQIITKNILGAEQLAQREVLFLPSGQALEALSFGYKNIVSNLLWFDLISYFGKHHSTDKQYPWLFHMCELVNSLDPRARHVVEFCAMMLSWEGGQPELANILITKGIQEEPDYWRYFYLRGFNSFYFLQSEEDAKRDFAHGATLPDAPSFLATMAAKKMAGSDPFSALNFLTTILKNTKDPVQRDPLETRLREVALQAQQQLLEGARTKFLDQYTREPKSLEELFANRLLDKTRWSWLQQISGAELNQEEEKLVLASPKGVKR